jgi:hypothetical protein
LRKYIRGDKKRHSTPRLFLMTVFGQMKFTQRLKGSEGAHY